MSALSMLMLCPFLNALYKVNEPELDSRASMKSVFIALLCAAAFHNASARSATTASPVVNMSLRTS